MPAVDLNLVARIRRVIHHINRNWLAISGLALSVLDVLADEPDVLSALPAIVALILRRYHTPTRSPRLEVNTHVEGLENGEPVGEYVI